MTDIIANVNTGVSLETMPIIIVSIVVVIAVVAAVVFSVISKKNKQKKKEAGSGTASQCCHLRAGETAQ